MKSKAPSIPYIIWMLVFTIIPLAMVVYYAFTDKSGNFTLQSFADSLFYTDVFVRSLWIALLSTAICLLIAYPLSYIMSRARASTRNVITMLGRFGCAFAGAGCTFAWQRRSGCAGYGV